MGRSVEGDDAQERPSAAVLTVVVGSGTASAQVESFDSRLARVSGIPAAAALDFFATLRRMALSGCGASYPRGSTISRRP